MTVNLKLKRLIIAFAVVALGVSAFLVHALAGLNARPVVYAAPPAFVERYATEMDHSDPSSSLDELGPDGGYVADPESAAKMADLSKEEAFIFNAIVNGEQLDLLLQLFAHPEKAQRVKIAAAFGEVNSRFSHDEESGYPQKRIQFWEDAKEHLPNIQNALSEALIASAEEGTETYLPYTLAWFPGQGRETVELLAWAAKHHPDPWVRRFSVYFVARNGGQEDLTGPLLDDRVHDPDYSVREQVLEARYRRFTGEW